MADEKKNQAAAQKADEKPQPKADEKPEQERADAEARAGNRAEGDAGADAQERRRDGADRGAVDRAAGPHDQPQDAPDAGVDAWRAGVRPEDHPHYTGGDGSLSTEARMDLMGAHDPDRPRGNPSDREANRAETLAAQRAAVRVTPVAAPPAPLPTPDNPDTSFTKE